MGSTLYVMSPPGRYLAFNPFQVQEFGKELEVTRYLDEMIDTLITQGENLKYVFYPVDREKLRQVRKTLGTFNFIL